MALIPDDIFSTMYPMESDRSAFPAQTPLAMAYVPVQKLSAVYESDVAFQTGTLFPDLDKPWLVGRGSEK